MAKVDLLDILYTKNKSPLDFNFDNLWIPSMYNYITPQDVMSLYNIASSIRYSAQIEKKYKAIDQIMVNRNFKKFHCGTNRVVYRFMEDQSFIMKIAIDRVGLSDNPAEYKNQFLLKPFVTKVFETSPCGTVATVERVQPILSRQEFLLLAPSIFELLNSFIIGKYILEDIGTKHFMNYGLRLGFGPCLLDYPYVFELDGSKLYCNKVDPRTGIMCGGLIDYDSGFNKLICTKCGKQYIARELEKEIKNNLILCKDTGVKFKFKFRRGDQVEEFNSIKETDCIIRK